MEPVGGTSPRASSSTPPASPPEAPRGSPSAAALPSGSTRPPARAAALPSLFQLLPDELADLLVDAGYERYRARQILDWVYRKRVRDASAMSNLARPLREGLDEVVSLQLPQVAELRSTARNDAVKYALRLDDGNRVEAVAMRSRRGVTLCVSSQAGCGMGCGFCATGTLGLSRNLKAHEIVAQVVLMMENSAWDDPGYNIVFMGMGEPLANYASTVQAIRVLNHPDALAIGARRITVSTVGLVPQIRRLAREGMQLGLAVSLHATTDELRGQIVPINRRYPIRELIDAARDFAERVGRRVTLEYVLLEGVNDFKADAERLGEIARSLPCKVNLIPYNPVPQLSWKRPSEAAIQRFVDVLMPRAPAVTVRWSQGGEVWAACGQLGSRPASAAAK